MGRPRALRLLWVAVLLALLSGGFVAAPSALAATGPSPSAGIGIRLLADPFVPAAEPLSLSYIVEHMAPGDRITRRVEIRNATNATADIVVYAAAADIVRNRFAFAPGTTGNQLSDSTTIGQPAVRLAPGASVQDDVTIAIPTAAPAGERYAVVWAQVSAPSPTQSGVRLINRVGVRMYVLVGPGGAPTPEFTVGPPAASRAPSGNPLVVASVHNLGRGALDITGSLTLSRGPGGLSAGPFPVELGALLPPDHSVIERVELDRRVPSGPWRAVLSLTSGGTHHDSVAEVTFPPALAAASGSPSAALLVGALMLLLVVVGVAVTLSWRRRRILDPS